mmetsp:Transcript_3894/g.11268  ORF Transcript_3894/g.11268 Transcript_3894/m.11268 type:complete len:226 (+) Transcript_3894:1358-2035(+)
MQKALLGGDTVYNPPRLREREGSHATICAPQKMLRQSRVSLYLLAFNACPSLRISAPQLFSSSAAPAPAGVPSAAAAAMGTGLNTQPCRLCPVRSSKGRCSWLFMPTTPARISGYSSSACSSFTWKSTVVMAQLPVRKLGTSWPFAASCAGTPSMCRSMMLKKFPCTTTTTASALQALGAASGSAYAARAWARAMSQIPLTTTAARLTEASAASKPPGHQPPSAP